MNLSTTSAAMLQKVIKNPFNETPIAAIAIISACQQPLLD